MHRLVNVIGDISLFELARLMGGHTYTSCAEVQAAANQREPSIPSEGQDVDQEDEDFWNEWLDAFDELC